MTKTKQQLLNEVNTMVGRLEELTYEEMGELVELEMTLADKGFDIESHEDLWIEMQEGK